MGLYLSGIFLVVAPYVGFNRAKSTPKILKTFIKYQEWRYLGSSSSITSKRGPKLKGTYKQQYKFSLILTFQSR